ncbi:hypothetical protein BDV96DRAFT_642752 [Lophiotrema nucula]|uniref:Uncharacterized protein n=1 Tax=Lophiotrema nucula TaxID=690887 RepID=A0A6A5ZL56_9PLEO|nr:hypothetical protein BDV96DRAFT_642752 [Lophiotrema nucula]
MTPHFRFRLRIRLPNFSKRKAAKTKAKISAPTNFRKLPPLEGQEEVARAAKRQRRVSRTLSTISVTAQKRASAALSSFEEYSVRAAKRTSKVWEPACPVAAVFKDTSAANTTEEVELKLL